MHAKVRSFDVRWSILLDADSTEDAATAALAIMRDPASVALVFNVLECDPDEATPLPGARRVTVDLLGS